MLVSAVGSEWLEQNGSVHRRLCNGLKVYRAVLGWSTDSRSTICGWSEFTLRSLIWRHLCYGS